MLCCLAKVVSLGTFHSGGKIFTDIAERKPIEGTTAGDIVSKHVTVSAQILIRNLRVRGHKRAMEATGGTKKKGPKLKNQPYPEKNNKKRLPFPSFTSVTLHQSIMSAAADIASVCSEFEIFAHRPIQTSVFGTVETAYKSIAAVDQNDLEFFYKFR